MRLGTAWLHLFHIREAGVRTLRGSAPLGSILLHKKKAGVRTLRGSAPLGSILFHIREAGVRTLRGSAPLLSIPIALPTEDDIKVIHELYAKIMSAIEEYYSAKSDHEKKSARVEVYATDKKINQFFYKKYGLSNEDVTIIENSLPKYDFLR